jgi:polyisoprenoid-binding protein YceI
MKQELKNKKVFSSIFLSVVMAVASLAVSQQILAQSSFTVRSYDMKISGTSNVHDWTMKANNATGNAQFDTKTGQLSSLTGLEFTVPVKGLKSNSDIMDGRTHTTLKADKHTKINFKLISAVVSPQQNNNYQIKATGNLTIAGVTKEVVLIANGVLNNQNLITVTCSKKIKMSEWQIKPPTYMLGAMKVGDEVTIDFNLKFNG